MTPAVFGPITIPDLLGRKLIDERSLALTTAPAHVISQISPEGVRYAVVIGVSLGRRAFMDLLYTLAPYKAHGPDRFARVLDNWGLHDRARTSSGSESLLLQHAASLKSSWHEFASHRELFMEVLQDQAEERRVTPVVTWSKQRDGRREWHFDPPDATLQGAIGALMPGVALDGSSGVQPDPLAGLVTIPYFLPELHKNWPAWRPLAKGGKSNYIGPASVPMMALMHRRALLNSMFIRCAEEYAGDA
jgi:hypothetical protein